MTSFLPPAYVVRREGNSFTSSVHTLGGYPYPIMLCNISQNAMGQPGGGEYPARSSWGGTLPGPAGGGLPCQVQLGGYPARSSWGGYPARGYPAGGVLCRGAGYPGRVPPRPGQDGGGYPVRTTEGVFTTRRAVCLLHSRRRTFLLVLCSLLLVSMTFKIRFTSYVMSLTCRVSISYGTFTAHH